MGIILFEVKTDLFTRDQRETAARSVLIRTPLTPGLFFLSAPMTKLHGVSGQQKKEYGPIFGIWRSNEGPFCVLRYLSLSKVRTLAKSGQVPRTCRDHFPDVRSALCH